MIRKDKRHRPIRDTEQRENKEQQNKREERNWCKGITGDKWRKQKKKEIKKGRRGGTG